MNIEIPKKTFIKTEAAELLFITKSAADCIFRCVPNVIGCECRSPNVSNGDIQVGRYGHPDVDADKDVRVPLLELDGDDL